MEAHGEGNEREEMVLEGNEQEGGEESVEMINQKLWKLKKKVCHSFDSSIALHPRAAAITTRLLLLMMLLLLPLLLPLLLLLLTSSCLAIRESISLSLSLSLFPFQVQGNPYQYNLHLSYIQSLRIHSRHEDLRHARENMRLIFPLTEGLVSLAPLPPPPPHAPPPLLL